MNALTSSRTNGLFLAVCGLCIVAPAQSPSTAVAHAAPLAAIAAAGQVAEADFISQRSNDQVTHIIVGRSLFINTRNRLSRVYVTNPEVLDSYTASPNQVVITAKKPGISNLLLWDETGVSRTYLVSADTDTTMLQQSIDRAFPREQLRVEGLEGRLVLSGTVGSDATADAALKLATQFSKDVTSSILVNSSQAKQVRLQVRMVEVDRAKMNNFAFNFFSAGGNNLASTDHQPEPLHPHRAVDRRQRWFDGRRQDRHARQSAELFSL